MIRDGAAGAEDGCQHTRQKSLLWSRGRDRPPWTIQSVLAWTAKDLAARGIESARLDAELLIARALGLRRLDLYLRHEQPLTDPELTRIRTLVERRRRFEPVAYILGEREFHGRMFTVDARVLIPRPETEELVEAVLSLLPAVSPGDTPAGSTPAGSTPVGSTPVRILDLGTGSGAIAVTLAATRPDVTVDAVELSPAAAEVAIANITRLGVTDRVRVRPGSLYKPVAGETYHVVVSNPPYIATAEVDALMPDVSQHEPRIALNGGPDGTLVLRPLVLGARAHLVPGGWLAVEIGHDQGPAARALAVEAGLTDIEIRRDLARIDRILLGRAPRD